MIPIKEIITIALSPGWEQPVLQPGTAKPPYNNCHFIFPFTGVCVLCKMNLPLLKKLDT